MAFLQSSMFRPLVQEPICVDELRIHNRPPWFLWVPLSVLLCCGLGLASQIVFSIEVPVASSIAGLWGVTILLIAVRSLRTTSVLLVCLLAVIIGTQLVVVLTLWQRISTLGRGAGVMSTVCSALTFSIFLNLPFRDPSWPSDDIAKTDLSCKLRSPEDNITLFQWMTVSWVKPLINLAIKRQLNDVDVWFLPYEFQHRYLHDTFRELRGSVVRRLLKANWFDLGTISLLTLMKMAATYSTPILLQQLLKAMDLIKFDKMPAIKWATIIVLIQSAAAETDLIMLWFQRRIYERSRGEMITMVHEKTLNRKIIGESHGSDEDKEEDTKAKSNGTANRPQEEPVRIDGKPEPKPISGLSKMWERFVGFFASKKLVKENRHQPASLGKILNIMRNDIYEVAQRFWEVDRLIQVPLGLIILLALAWNLLGWACLFGVGVVVLTQLMNAAAARVLLRVERRRRAATDIKLQRISQYVEAIRHLRWYGWHLSWLEQVMEARRTELSLKRLSWILTVLITFLNRLGGALFPVAAFYAFTVLAGRELRVDIAFPALQLFTLLRTNIEAIPELITVLLNARVAMGRIEDFMAEPDKPEEFHETHDELELQHATFSWPGTSRPVLTDITLTFPPGLNLVIGVVGSGKTALLQALLGELDLDSGNLIKPKDMPLAYASQTPWLQSMSIRENILFTQPYDEERYRQVLEACALLPDLADLPHGDLSPIGENGVGLSGGQKARVALARAIYSHANIVLLDDPISALDQQTAEWIVQKCLTGPLAKCRSIVMVTHRIDLFQGLAKQTIEIEAGRARVYAGDHLNVSKLSAPALVERHPEEASKQLQSSAIPENFEDEEHRAHGGVLARVYWEYIKAGKFRWWFFMIIFAAITRVMQVSEMWYLKAWGEAYSRGKEQFLLVLADVLRVRASETPVSRFFDQLPDPNENVTPWLQWYFIIAVLEAVAVLITYCFTIILTLAAARTMFQHVMLKISSAPFVFYDKTPIGRLMNRVTSDVGTVDGQISRSFMFVAWQIIAWISSIVVFASVTPHFLVFSLLLTASFVWIFLTFLPASQSLRRLEMVSLSPLMSNFGALLSGLSTVRAFCLQPAFLTRVINVTDAFQRQDHFFWSVQGWLQIRFDLLSACSTFLLTILAVYSNLTAGLTAFVLTSAQQFVQSTHGLCRAYGQLQLDFVSVERVVELLHLEMEDPGSITPPAAWPKYGSSITFENLTISYSPDSPPAISNVSFTVPGGTHVALVGRTGSGKSTLALSLLATTPPTSGRILIDGIDIYQVDKQALRSRITFLAQDPVLFPGTLRHNLDPQGDYSDADCAHVLALAFGDSDASGSTPASTLTINTEIATHGSNLSQGQRQLVSLARALLRQCAVVVMDEATASVDLGTADRVMRVVREKLQARGVTVTDSSTSPYRGPLPPPQSSSSLPLTPVPLYLRIVATISSWLSLAGYTLFALIFTSARDNVRLSRTATMTLAALLLTAGYLGAAVTLALSRRALRVQYNVVLLPFLLTSVGGLIEIVLNHSLHESFPVGKASANEYNNTTPPAWDSHSLRGDEGGAGGTSPLLREDPTTIHLNHINSNYASSSSRPYARYEMTRLSPKPSTTAPIAAPAITAITTDINNMIPSDEAQRRQLLRLLLAREQDSRQDAASSTTYHIDWPGGGGDSGDDSPSAKRQQPLQSAAVPDFAAAATSSSSLPRRNSESRTSISNQWDMGNLLGKGKGGQVQRQ
ncbi:hypothetical protein DV736_g3124, partial [Chaetothyriales sp. CBS 134916]